jgi:hypothetical protein
LHELIKRDVDRSIQLADKKAVKLHQATADHIGLELMHQFVLDLLGHDTSAAKIFIQKVSRHIYIYIYSIHTAYERIILTVCGLTHVFTHRPKKISVT